MVPSRLPSVSAAGCYLPVPGEDFDLLLIA